MTNTMLMFLIYFQSYYFKRFQVHVLFFLHDPAEMMVDKDGTAS